MSLGIVILNYNDSDSTIELIERIKNYKILDLIVVVDNNSTDNSFELIKKYESDKIKVLKSNENAGYGAGNNIGAKFLEKNGIDYIIISNPDVIFKQKDLKKLLINFKEESIAIVSPTIKENNHLNRGWKFQGTIADALSNINYIGRFIKKKKLYKDEHYNKKISEVDVMSGCFFIIRSKIFKEIGYFDENTFLYYEENIIAKKIANINKKIIVDNKVQIIHNHSVSVNKTYDKINKFKILAKSQKYYHKVYNNAGFIKLAILDISCFITIIISNILNKIRIVKTKFNKGENNKMKSKSDIVIDVQNVSKHFNVYFDKANTLKERIIFWKRNNHEVRKVLNDINVQIRKGETVALIGVNGSGKSTLLKLMTKIIYPNSGKIEVNGKLTSMLELGAGFHPDFSGLENIYFNASIFGLSKKEIDSRLENIIEFSELRDYMENPVRTYSSGMYMRLAFSIAINVDADILLIDEILSVGDRHFQEKCYKKMQELKKEGKTIVLVTHDLGSAEKLCDRTIWLNNGKIKLDGESKEVLDEYVKECS